MKCPNKKCKRLMDIFFEGGYECGSDSCYVCMKCRIEVYYKDKAVHIRNVDIIDDRKEK